MSIVIDAIKYKGSNLHLIEVGTFQKDAVQDESAAMPLPNNSQYLMEHQNYLKAFKLYNMNLLT